MNSCATPGPSTEPTARPVLELEVTCADGRVRHEGTFPDEASAWRWAQWGHVCLANHTVSAVAS